MDTRVTRGFTLLELLVTIAVSTILLTIGIPSFLRTVADNQRVSYSADVYNVLNYARSEAIAYNTKVIICKSANETACSASAQWSDGWIVFTNPAGAGTQPASDDDILQTHAGFKNFTLTSAALPNKVVYLPSGRASVPGDFLLCSNSTNVPGRSVSITSSGRPRVASATCPTGGS